ncbi:MAG: hypothetical protein E6289_19175 [Clostridium sp.]|uniref:hypothetical protein n=1 Tax=Clostridium sp. TaxID=1506 RepID=UPI00290E1567|nr:hypothetical protein [Clostridium sp.]MDU7180016.1 hypothetical protein [Clostridium sp.]
MNKKKLLGTTLAVLIGLTSSVPVFADTTTSNTSNTITQTSDKCKTRIGHKKNKLTTEQIAEKLNIDITGLSEDEAKAAVKEAMAEKHLAKLQEKASELGINTANLSEDQIRTAVREAMGTENSEKHLAKLQQKAAELGIVLLIYLKIKSELLLEKLWAPIEKIEKQKLNKLHLLL